MPDPSSAARRLASRTWWRCVIAVSVVLAVGAENTAAQDPVRLPGMVVKGERVAPGPKVFAGVVRDTFELPIEGVEVTIPGLRLRTITKADGSFRFIEVGAGSHDVRAKKLGFAPQVRTFKVASDGGTGDFELVPFPYSLPTVTSSAVRGGLSGIVADTGYNPVPGAFVSVLGKAMHATTDSSGSFFIAAPPGSWMVTIRKEGYADRTASVRVPEDSGRFMTAHLLPAYELPLRERWNLRDLDARQSWRNKLTQPFYTREDIQAMGIIWIHDLVRIGGADQFDVDCSVVVNGGPRTANLATLTVDDVDAVEVYGGTRFSKPASMHTGLQPIGRPPKANAPTPKLTGGAVPTSNAGQAGAENRGKLCPIVYVWMR